MEVQKKRLRFLTEAIEYYSVNPLSRRNIEINTNNVVKYSSCKKTSEGCVLGRKLPIKVAKAFDTEDIFLGEKKFFDLLPKKLQVLGIEFLEELQGLHDFDAFWEKKGLSDRGERFVEKLKRKFCS